ncbi:peptide chain release factor 2 [Buchnera aphidicola]|uniref:peptide chain release factor 2 n=1 Tax=Buchnera aphidicola TaxID=9 RepID=UPI0031B67549
MFEINIIKNKIKSYEEKINDIRGFFNYEEKKNTIRKINLKLNNPEIWNNPKIINKINKEKINLKKTLFKIEKIIFKLKIIKEEFELNLKEKKKNFNNLLISLGELKNMIKKMEFYFCFSNIEDSFNCYLDIQAGSGGIDAQDWAKIMLRMYLKWLDQKRFKVKIIHESNNEASGIKSVTAHIIGPYAFGWLRTETGIHRLVRKSPFNAGSKRHTSFASVFVYPEIDDSINIEIKNSDLRIDVYRASGAGGQHVNRTESAVRITHLPTGIVTQCQNNRSQHKNKENAIKQIKCKLYQLELRKKNKNKKNIEKNKSDIAWGNQIRSYILDNSRIKDLRTKIETRNVQNVLNGELDQFIESSLKLGV